jgi:hypothetical protein
MQDIKDAVEIGGINQEQVNNIVQSQFMTGNINIINYKT